MDAPPIGKVAWPGMINQPLGQRQRQEKIALGNGDEAVVQTMEPELLAAGAADRLIHMGEVRDAARAADAGGKDPAVQRFPVLRPAAVENDMGSLRWCGFFERDDHVFTDAPVRMRTMMRHA